ncbi:MULTISPECIES: conjugative transfer protein MobI(A/C) [unclassified Shewanella]|jgi:hypothetical protein|uniref:conjugative transfer protein MobI(A/C) n=1 Tax=Shewanella TaxID=22 RepID=UPI0021D8205A|nr:MULTISPECIES: conjugative transfer protein MobI(A/C) [unclassified Shewanella]MCU7988702.1 hypothetical protein [Shewanella sp. SW24]MCU8001217.1 hypothetical protein [Shewanella sp. SM95]MCU8019252.1 hypothetical protein [Shewanella sp. SM72]MCU8023145.1 hypothetical protein [Shewanella sp. SM78]MCU8041188.1 hypothetical protein [Shewanella sp. SM69]
MNDYSGTSGSSENGKPVPALGFQLANTIRSLEGLIEAAQFQAKVIVDDYWLKWRSSNRQLRSDDGGKFSGGEMAPRVVVKNEKVYLVWTRYRPGRVGNISKSWGDDVKPTQRGYTLDQLTRKSPEWEARMIEDTENRLAPLRETLECLHEAKIKLRRIERKQS